MIIREWHGQTLPENADKYQQLLKNKILQGFHRAQGYRGAWILRGEQKDGAVPFATLTLWDSMDTIKALAGEDYERAIIEPEARALLSHADPRAVHYDATWCE